MIQAQIMNHFPTLIRNEKISLLEIRIQKVRMKPL